MYTYSNLYCESKPFIDLMPFMEKYDKFTKDKKNNKKYIISGTTVHHAKQIYRIETYHWKEKYCYVFIDITIGTLNHKIPFAKKPSDIQKMLNENRLIIKSIPKP